MADPFSVAGSAIGVVSLGITACKGLIWYIDNAKEAKEKTSCISARVDSLADLLELLQSVVGGLDPSSCSSSTVSAITACDTAINNIRKKLGSSSIGRAHGSTIRARLHDIKFRLSYPFKQGEIVYLKDLLEGVQQELHTALLILQL
jgi:hypothetical protein